MILPTRFMRGRVSGVRRAHLPRMGALLRANTLPALPQRQDWYSSVASWPMLLNGDPCSLPTGPISDCTIASVGHMAQQESIYAGGPELLMTDPEALAGYKALNPGLVLGNPATDTGLYEGDVGHHWVKNGFQVGGQIDKIVAFADCDQKNLDELKYSILLTGNAMLAFDMPEYIDTTDEWAIEPRDPGELDGHAVPAVGWDEAHLWVVSWGALVPVTWPFVKQYLLEVHVTLSRRWMNAKGVTPAGFSWDQLVAATRQFARAA